MFSASFQFMLKFAIYLCFLVLFKAWNKELVFFVYNTEILQLFGGMEGDIVFHIWSRAMSTFAC